jgi:Tol biopolymer transport system component
VPVTTYPGVESSGTFSPDGNQVAFTWEAENPDSSGIYVKYVDGGKPLRLTAGPHDGPPAWSPDGRSIAFSRSTESGAAIYSVSPLGGSERKVTDLNGMGGARLSWSPDGKVLAFFDADSRFSPAYLVAFSLTTGERRRLTAPSSDFQFAPAFSPDGRMIAHLKGKTPSTADVYLMSANGGKGRRLTFDNSGIQGLTWTADGKEIVFDSNQTGSSVLWKIAAAGGKPEPVAGSGTGANEPQISRRGDRLVYTSQVWDTNIWRRDSQGHAQPEKLVESTRLDENPQYSPDGTRIAFASARTGAFEIWVAKSDGTDLTQLTSMNAEAAWPTWSPDGKKIAFNANRSKTNLEIYVNNSDGGTPRPLTAEASLDAKPSWSVDGNWIYFGSDRSGVLQIWKLPANGGPAVQVTHHGGDSPAVSPDGRFVYFAGLRQKAGVCRMPTNGGDEQPVLEDLPGAAQGRWVPARNGIYFAVQDQSWRHSEFHGPKNWAYSAGCSIWEKAWTGFASVSLARPGMVAVRPNRRIQRGPVDA